MSTIKDIDDFRKVNGAAATLELIEAAGPVHIPQTPDRDELKSKPWICSLADATVTSSELRDLELPQRQPILGSWLCEADYGIVIAERGVGKTWFTLNIARALTEGGTMGPWKAPGATKVLYLDGEMPPDLIRVRDIGLSRKKGDVYFVNHQILFDREERSLNIANFEVQAAITQHCLDLGIKVVILDNLSTLAGGVKENDADAWELLSGWLLTLRRNQIAVILVHHAGRNGQARGTSRREDAAAWVIALDNKKGASEEPSGAHFVSRFSKPSRNAPNDVPAYEWRYSTDSLTGAVSVTHREAQAIDVFRQLITEGVTRCDDLAQELKVSSGTISKWAKKGMNEGWLKKEGREYALIED